jgi:site-specific DNA-methyltransferase (adenine-specific)
LAKAKLLQGDALEALRTLKPGSCGALLCDPPYSSGGQYRGDRASGTNAKYVSNAGLYPEFTGDNRDQRSYLAWSTLWLLRAREIVAPGGLCAVFTDWRQLPITTDALQAAGWVWRGIVPWDKIGGRPALGRYRAQAEYVVWGSNGPRPLKGKAAAGVFRESVPREKLHTTAKPVGLMEELLSVMEGPILDPFMGSGTVGEACANLGLDYVGVELDPTYFAVARDRLAAHKPLRRPAMREERRLAA